MRSVDWRERLEAEIESARTRPSVFGTHDCLQFCARCVQAMTGENYAARFPSYDSQEAAQVILDAHGDVTGLLTPLFGEPVAPNLAQCGDVVMAIVKGRETAGMCLGTHCVFPGIAAGLSFRTRECIVHAWRID